MEFGVRYNDGIGTEGVEGIAFGEFVYICWRDQKRVE
jgi:hypothetical protein